MLYETAKEETEKCATEKGTGNIATANINITKFLTLTPTHILHLLPVIRGIGTGPVSSIHTREQNGTYPPLTVNRKENTSAMTAKGTGIEMTWISSVQPSNIHPSLKHPTIPLILTLKAKHLLPPL